MLIEFLRRPSTKTNTRTVECFGQKYVFKEIIPGRWVADVNDPKAAKALIDTGAYREFTDQLPTSTLTAPAPAPAPAPPLPPAPVVASAPATNPSAEQAQTDAGGTDAGGETGGGPAVEAPAITAPPAGGALDDAAKQLLVGVPTQVRKAAKTAEKDVLVRALAIEQAQERPRASVVALLQELVQG